MATEENKETVQEVKPQEAKQEAQPQKAKPQEVKQEAKPQEPKPQVEKQTNCLACGKPLKKIRKYYRDGKFYCTKKCWLKHRQKQKEEKEKKG